MLLAPNGKRSNLTKEQYELVRTPQFKAWFGDWENDPQNASKVVDENGEPMVVYHGTIRDFNEFKYAEFGFHFGTLEQANKKIEYWVNLGAKSRIIPCFLNIKGVLETKDLIKFYYDRVKKYLYRNLKIIDAREYYNDKTKLQELLVQKGIDGFKYWNTEEGDGYSYLCFYPNQIKLADGTNTTFDMNSNDIRYASGGKIYSSRLLVPEVRGGWTKDKILRYFKKWGSDTITTYTLLKFINDFDSWQDFKNNLFYHGTTSYISKGLKPSIVFSERYIEKNGGGGYGQRYWGISLTKNKRIAESFSGMRDYVSIYPVFLKKDAKVVEMLDIQDSAEIEDIIVDLYEQGIDAVWIGGGEEELVVINPNAIMLYKKGEESFNVYGGFKSKNLSDEKIKEIYDTAKKLWQEYSSEYNKSTSLEHRKKVLSSLEPIKFKKGGRTIAQTPAPKKDRIYGSKVNKVGSASSEKSAKSIVLSKKIIDSLKDKLLVFKQKHPSKTNITIDDLKAVYRRGLGAYSSSHRPTISGGVPNSRNAWAMARVNKFLLKAGGTKVKKAYVQDDDLMAKGGKVVVDERDMLKFKKIGIDDVYEIEAIKDIGLQGFNFDKQTILDVINKRFNSLLIGYEDYLVDEDSEAITRAMQNDINARREQGDSLENIKSYEKLLTNESERQRYLDNYRDTQRGNILEWVNYLKQSEYDEAFKYLMLKSVLEFNYDFKTNKLIERTNKTLRNFTNFDAGTLSEVYGSRSKYLLKDYVELQVKNIDAIVKSKNMVKQSKDGYWIKFDGGSKTSQEQITKNAKELSQLVQNTYWCTKTNAKSQLNDGDFYVYVTKFEKELLPRIAIRMEDERVGEVRGNKSAAQDLEDDMIPIAKEFLENNIPNDSGKRWLDGINYNSKVIDMINKINQGGLYDGFIYEYAELKLDEKNYLLDYSNENGNVTRLTNLIEYLIVKDDLGTSNYKKSDFAFDDYKVDESTRFLFGNIYNRQLLDISNLEIIFGNIEYAAGHKDVKINLKIVTGRFDISFTNITSLGELKIVGGDLKIFKTNLISLGKLEKIGGSVALEDKINSLGELEYVGVTLNASTSKITSLGKLKYVGGTFYPNLKIKSLDNLEYIGDDVDFGDLNITSLGKLHTIEGNAYFDNSKITSLGELKFIGGNAMFKNSKIKSLDKLERIGYNAYFQESKITSLGELKSIGNNAEFKDSNIKSLGKLETIGGNVYFQDTKITSLGELKSIGKNAEFVDSNIKSLGKLETIGGDAYFNDSLISSLDELKSIGGSVDFANTQITSLGKLKSIGRNVFFNDSLISSLGELKYIGGNAIFNNSKITSLGDLKTIIGQIHCDINQLDLFLILKNARFFDFDNQQWYNEHKKN